MIFLVRLFVVTEPLESPRGELQLPAAGGIRHPELQLLPGLQGASVPIRVCRTAVCLRLRCSHAATGSHASSLFQSAPKAEQFHSLHSSQVKHCSTSTCSAGSHTRRSSDFPQVSARAVPAAAVAPCLKVSNGLCSSSMPLNLPLIA